MRLRTPTMIVAVAVSIGGLAVPAGPAAAAGAAPLRAAGRPAAAEPTAAQRAFAVEPGQHALAAKKKKKKPKTVALTFDDGPSDYTYKVLDKLKQYKVKATFCIVGNNVANYPKTTLRIIEEGHRLCNHSYTHADLTTLTSAEVKQELVDCQTALEDATEVTPKVVRFPYGASNAKVRKVAKDLKLRSLGWTVDPQDWKDNPSAKTITARIVKNVKPGAVVLLHDGGGDRSQTAASLPGTIAKLKKKGYKFVLA
ncbi:MAG TPA: polysaccharide deacetylase family protein [Actinoplanes sp.]|nr:polysaccharide deacetylase family protein [Actinoplanes sp.]